MLGGIWAAFVAFALLLMAVFDHGGVDTRLDGLTVPLGAFAGLIAAIIWLAYKRPRRTSAVGDGPAAAVAEDTMSRLPSAGRLTGAFLPLAGFGVLGPWSVFLAQRTFADGLWDVAPQHR